VVCTDEKKTAGAPHHIVLSVEPPLVKPDGSAFKITANGTDAAFILAKVVDDKGVWCPTANNFVTWRVSGPANYRGGADQFVTPGQGVGYHAPGDSVLTAEGGMCKVAVRSTFTPGTVNVTAVSPSLGQGTASFTVYPVPPQTATVPHPGGRPMPLSDPLLKLGKDGKSIRFLMPVSGLISVDLLDAGGRMLCRVPASRRAAGWHVLAPGLAVANGICFVRFNVNGKAFVAKQVLLLR
jgi:hypothetical protein